jgi:two-component system sensor histidine kinase and response regulator WspE
VREVQRQLLGNRGYDVTVAVDGIDGWHAVRDGEFDLVITDVDMPRMTGIDLVKSVKRDPRLKSIPMMIVSYRDREEDKQRGLEAGADYYFTKSDFHDDALLRAVSDLIGDPP